MSAVLYCGDIALKSSLILAFAWAATKLMRRAAASNRHLVWLSAFLMLVALPAIRTAIPTWDLVVLREDTLKSEAIPIESPTPFMKDLPVAPPLDVTGKTARIEKQLPSSQEVPPSTVVLTAFWLAGFLAVCVQGVWGVVALRRLAKRSHRPDNFNDRELNRLNEQARLRRSWELRVSRVSQPPAAMTWGLIKPVVMLPKKSASWKQDRLEAVLLHELAHVRRFDYMSQLISVAASALYWFNPIVWLCARAMRAEAEIAADDAVIGMGLRPSDYARELLQIAADLGHRKHRFAYLGVTVMNQSKIESRVKAILDPASRRRRGMTAIDAIATVGLVAAGAVSLCALHPVVGAVPAEPAIEMLVPQERAVFPKPAPSPVPMAASLTPNLAVQKVKQSDKDAEIRRLKAEIKALKDKFKAADLSGQAKKLHAQVEAMRAQQDQVRQQLDKARAELMSARARMENDQQRKVEQFQLQSEDQKRAFKEYARALNEQERAQTEKLQAAEEVLKAQQKIMADQQKAGSDAQRVEMAARMSDAKRQLEMAYSELERDREKVRQRDLHTDRQKTDIEIKLQIIEAQKNIEIATARLSVAKSEIARKRALLKQGNLAQEDLDQAEANIKVMQAQLAAETAKLNELKRKS